MNLLEKLGYYFLHPNNIRIAWLIKHSKNYSDEEYLIKLFKVKCGYKPNLENPQTFNEKLNWLKLHHHNPLLTILADKYAVKEYVKEKIGVEYVVPNYGVWGSFDEIDFDNLPSKFVLKATHDSGGATIVRDKKTLDVGEVRKKMEKQLSTGFYWASREWPYKDIPRRIIADELLNDHTGNELRDYKFWCFNGMPKYMYLTIKGKNIYENFYDMDFRPANINHGFPRHQPEFEKPYGFETMKELAAKLSQGLPFVRIDFFLVDKIIYFGEFTFFDWGGTRPFESYEMDLELGKLIDLSIVKQ